VRRSLIKTLAKINKGEKMESITKVPVTVQEHGGERLVTAEVRSSSEGGGKISQNREHAMHRIGETGGNSHANVRR